MVNNHGFIIHKANHKKGRRHDYDIYKENHPATPKQVVNVVDLGYLGIENLGIEKDYPEQLLSTPNRKKRNQELSDDHKELQQKSFQKEDSYRAYYMSIEKIQDICSRCI